LRRFIIASIEARAPRGLVSPVQSEADGLGRVLDGLLKASWVTEDIETARALRQAANLDNLKAIFGHAWTAATKEQQPIIKDIYDHRKADFEAEQEAA